MRDALSTAASVWAPEAAAPAGLEGLAIALAEVLAQGERGVAMVPRAARPC